MLPKIFWLVLNYRCNNRCAFCYAEPTGYSNTAEMPLEYAKQVMSTLATGGAKICLLIGGEPTLYSHLDEIIRFGVSVGLSVRIITNGRKFFSRSFLEKVVEAGLSSASISFEAATENNFSLITGSEKSWRETVGGIENALALGLPINTLTTLNVLNKDQIVDIVKFVYSLGVRKILFNFATPNCSKSEVDFKHVLRPDIAAAIIEGAYLELAAMGIKIGFLPTLPICCFSEAVRDKLFLIDKAWCACHIYQGSGAVFDPNGQLLPCTHLTEVPTASVIDENGNFSSNEFLDFWNKPDQPPARLRNEIWKYPSVKCKACAYWGKCIGGCPIFRSVFSPETFIT